MTDSPLQTQINKLRTFVEQELAEHDEELLAIREEMAKRFGVLDRRIRKIGQGLRRLREVVSLVRKTVAHLAGRPVE